MANITLINMDQAVQGWAAVTVDRLKEALHAEGVVEYSRELLESITAELQRNGGTLEKVIIKFQQYGRFVDMGVGRGVPTGSRGTAAFSRSRHSNGRLRSYGRTAKRWYSKTKTREVSILRQILVRDYGINTLAELENGLSITTTENLF